MNRFKVATLLFLFSLLCFTAFVSDAQAQADPEVQKILAQIAQLEKQRAKLVDAKTEANKAIKRVELDKVEVQAYISDVEKKISHLDAEIAMAVDEDFRDFLIRFQASMKRLLEELNQRYDQLERKQTAIENKISVLDKQIADIDNQLMSLYARLAQLV